MIGVFDSGFGGLTVLKEVHRALPDHSTIYLGDNARAPYGPRSPEAIYRFTTECITELFDRGAGLVVLACNTASATALRRIQQEFLPSRFPGRTVLGVVRPAVETVAPASRSKHIGVLGTVATVRSRAYSTEFAKVDPSITAIEHACPLFVPLIEAGEQEWEGTRLVAQRYLGELFSRDPGIDSVLLACTHYPMIQNVIEKFVPEGVSIYSQGPMVAKKLREYLAHHPELASALDRARMREYLTTDDPRYFEEQANMFLGEKVLVEKASF